MWSVWSDTVDMYLGVATALVKRKGLLSSLKHPATMPMDRVLAKVAEALSREAGADGAGKVLGGRARLRVWLGGNLCPAMRFTVPQGVTRWAELQAISRASAAAQLQQPQEQTLCELDIRHKGIAAAIPQAVLAQLRHWGAAHGARLVSVQPLWSAATQCALAQRDAVKAVAVYEPGVLTLLGADNQSQTQAFSILGGDDPESAQAHLRRWLLSHGLEENDLQQLHFNARPGDNASSLPDGPKAWAAHWAIP